MAAENRSQSSGVSSAEEVVAPSTGLSLVAKILIGLVAIIGAFLVYVAMQPPEFRISRSAKMAAPPAAPFAQVNDFHKWQAWSPWAKLDPKAKNSFEGPESGEGAKFSWSGNAEVGEGSMVITQSQEPDLIRLKVEFKKPMEDKADTEFTFKPEGDQTLVTWTMSGKNNFVGRLVCTLMNMDKMVGDKFEEGLASLKAIVEAKPATTDTPADTTAKDAQAPAKS